MTRLYLALGALVPALLVWLTLRDIAQTTPQGSAPPFVSYPYRDEALIWAALVWVVTFLALVGIAALIRKLRKSKPA